MPATTPTGLLAEPLYHLAFLIASSTAFQTWTATENATAALAHVHIVEPDDGPVTHPFCVVTWEKCRWNAVAGGTGLQHQANGEMYALFEAKIDETDINVSKEPAYKFTNSLGAIIQDMLDKSGTGGYLFVPSITMDEKPNRASESYLGTLGDFYQAKLTIGWGLQ